MLEFLELALAHDRLVDVGVERALPFTFRQNLDRAAREIRLYSDVLHKFDRRVADFCRCHLAVAMEYE